MPHRADAHTGGEATTQAAPIVADGEQQVTVASQLDATGPSCGVSQHVGHRLAGDGQNGRFDRGGQRPEVTERHPHVHRPSAGQAGDAFQQRVSQPGCGHHLIAQLVDVGADLVHPVPQLSPGVVRQHPGRVGSTSVQVIGDRVQLEHHRGQPRPQPVVKISLVPGTLLVLRDQQAVPGHLEVIRRPARRHDGGDGVGQRVEQRTVGLGQAVGPPPRRNLQCADPLPEVTELEPVGGGQVGVTDQSEHIAVSGPHCGARQPKLGADRCEQTVEGIIGVRRLRLSAADRCQHRVRVVPPPVEESVDPAPDHQRQRSEGKDGHHRPHRRRQRSEPTDGHGRDHHHRAVHPQCDGQQGCGQRRSPQHHPCLVDVPFQDGHHHQHLKREGRGNSYERADPHREHDHEW